MTAPAPIRIRRVTVRKLFGLYDHTIEMKLEDRVTIIHGPNGVGKTVILKFLVSLFAGRLAECVQVRFSSFDVELTDGTFLSLEAITDRELHNIDGNNSKQPFKLRAKTAEGDFVHEIGMDGAISSNKHIIVHVKSKSDIDIEDPNDTTSKRSYYIGSQDEGSNDDTDLFPDRRVLHTEPAWFTTIRKKVSVHVIEAQRLLQIVIKKNGFFTGNRQAMVPMVQHHAQDLRRRVNESLSQYASESQSLDRSFPDRLIRSSQEDLSIEEIKRRMSALDEKRALLQTLGLLQDSAAHPFDIGTLDNLDPTKRQVMTLYVQDTEWKLGVLDDLARRVELLRDKVNGKLRHKTIQIDREKGITAVGVDGQPIDLHSLSSGEQHELVLMFDLLFRVQPDTLVLIDEPELSLHVSWQKRFLPDLLEIVQAAKFDALVATHSPFIVGDRSDLMVPLAAELV